MRESGGDSERDEEAAHLIDEIYDALEVGDPEVALDLARRGLRSPGGEDPVLRCLAGEALMDLGRPEEAAEELRRAVEMDPNDADFRADLARALFQACRFDEARVEARRGLRIDGRCAAAHVVTGLLLERQGALAEADRHFTRAARLDPERFPRPARLSRAEFETEVRRSAQRLPEEFRDELERAVVTVEDLPSEEILRDQHPPLDPELLGLFVGVARPERSAFSAGGELPPRILLFQRNLERYALGDRDELRRQIAVTLYHELGHYLGFDEDGLDELDLG